MRKMPTWHCHRLDTTVEEHCVTLDVLIERLKMTYLFSSNYLVKWQRFAAEPYWAQVFSQILIKYLRKGTFHTLFHCNRLCYVIEGTSRALIGS